jgi:hypothetical protein
MFYLYHVDNEKTLEKAEGEIKNGKSRQTGNIGYTRHRANGRQTKQQTQQRLHLRC